jgi:hypothetical protein
VSARRGALTGIALVVMVSGCGGGGDDDNGGAKQSGPPAGFTRFSGAGISVDYPKDGWVKDSAATGSGDQKELLNVHGPRGENDLFARVRVLREPRSDVPTISQLGKDLADRRPFELNHGKKVSDGKTTVDGATGAWKVVTDFEVPLKKGGSAKSRATEVIAITDKYEYLLSVGDPEGTLAPGDAETIAGSLHVS